MEAGSDLYSLIASIGVPLGIFATIWRMWIHPTAAWRKKIDRDVLTINHRIDSLEKDVKHAKSNTRENIKHLREDIQAIGTKVDKMEKEMITGQSEIRSDIRSTKELVERLVGSKK